MKTCTPLLIVLLSVAGCATPDAASPQAPPTVPAPAPATTTPPAPVAPDERAFAFACDNGDRIQVRFSKSRKSATLVRHGESIELPQQPSGSGFIYGDGRTTLRGKGDDLMLEIGRMAPIRCREG